jgi:hypothetical protein
MKLRTFALLGLLLLSVFCMNPEARADHRWRSHGWGNGGGYWNASRYYRPCNNNWNRGWRGNHRGWTNNAGFRRSAYWNNPGYGRLIGYNYRRNNSYRGDWGHHRRNFW